jgi:hypothetical protein
MSNSRIDPPTTSVQVEPTRTRQTTQPITPFSQVLTGSANALLRGAQIATSVVGGPVLAAAVGEVGHQVIGGFTGGGGGTSGSPAEMVNAGGKDPVIAQTEAMNRQSQTFSLQLLALQQEVQDENRRFTTLSNVLKASHETAKAAVTNIR